MRIALLSDCYAPRLGGIEVQVHDLAQHLTAVGHEVEVLTATAGADGAAGGTRRVEDGVAVHRFALPLPGGPLRIPVNPLAVPAVRDRLRQGGFDAVHAHMGVVSPFALDGVRVSLGLGLPTAVTWHCVLERSRPLMAALGYAARWARRGAALSAVSTMAAERVGDIAGGAPVEVLGNGIDAGSWARPVDRPEPPAGPLRIVTALRLARRKRPHAAIDVLARARDQAGDGALHLTLFGEGPQRPVLERLIDVRGLADAVDLPGRVSRDVLRGRLWDSHVYLNAARLEAFGIAALEGRAAGLPVLARHGTGVADFVRDGVDGILAPEDAGLAAALVSLVREPDRLERLRAAARSQRPPQDWPLMVEVALAEYRRAGAG